MRTVPPYIGVVRDHSQWTPYEDEPFREVPVKPKEWDVLRLAVEQGTRSGFHRIGKHDLGSGPEGEDAVVEAVLSAISEWFDFPPYGESADA